MIGNMSLLLFVFALCSITAARAEEESPPNATQQIESLREIESLQLRADKLAFGKIGPDNYHLAKAHTWLDMALSEYHENESNGIVPSALEQAESLLDTPEEKQADVSMETPVEVPGSEAVRPDLWNRIATLKKHEQFSCGQRATAEAEIYLVWAGHEKAQSSWEHAQSYVHSAEQLIDEAQTSISVCIARMPLVEIVAIFLVLRCLTLTRPHRSLLNNGGSTDWWTM